MAEWLDGQRTPAQDQEGAILLIAASFLLCSVWAFFSFLSCVPSASLRNVPISSRRSSILPHSLGSSPSGLIFDKTASRSKCPYLRTRCPSANVAAHRTSSSGRSSACRLAASIHEASTSERDARSNASAISAGSSDAICDLASESSIGRGSSYSNFITLDVLSCRRASLVAMRSAG